MAGRRPACVPIAEWTHDPPGAADHRPAHLLDATICGWLATRAASVPQRWPAIAIDGKSVRGARGANGRAVHLLAALDHGNRVVLGQRVVDGKTNEITEFAPLLEGIDITGVIVTADARHTQREHTRYLIGPGALPVQVKGNQRTQHAELKDLAVARDPRRRCHPRQRDTGEQSRVR